MSSRFSKIFVTSFTLWKYLACIFVMIWKTIIWGKSFWTLLTLFLCIFFLQTEFFFSIIWTCSLVKSSTIKASRPCTNMVSKTIVRIIFCTKVAGNFILVRAEKGKRLIIKKVCIVALYFFLFYIKPVCLLIVSRSSMQVHVIKYYQSIFMDWIFMKAFNLNVHFNLL